MRHLAIIPARAGSKRIPRKNVRLLHGRPLLAWAVATAQACGLFDEVMVSTDDPAIATIARKAGATVPFLRSPETSDDHATTTAVLSEVLDMYAARGITPTLACCIYPGAALITPAQLQSGYMQLAADPFLDGVMAVQRYRHPIERAFHRDPDGTLRRVQPQHASTRTQDLAPAWHDAGQFYWFRPATLRALGQLLGTRYVGVPLAPWEAVDLDDEEDWRLLEKLTSGMAPTALPVSA